MTGGLILAALLLYVIFKVARKLDEIERVLGERVNAQPYWGRLSTRPRSPSIYRRVGK